MYSIILGCIKRITRSVVNRIKKVSIIRELRNKDVFFQDNARLIDFESCSFEGGNLIRPNVCLIGVDIGYGSYIAKGSTLLYTSIGRYSCIGPNVCVVEGEHPTRGFVSIHPSFFSTSKQSGFTYVNEGMFDEHRYAKGNKYIVIGNDVWIGGYSLLLEGINIGDGAIIAAGSMVTKDVEPYEIVGGVPAKHIRKRFNDEDARFIQSTKWWNMNPDELKKIAHSFCDIHKFRTAINK